MATRNNTVAGAGPSLRIRVTRAAAFLIGRSILGSVVSLITVVVVTREIGPANYGIYVAAAGVVNYLAIISRLGVDVYLIRREDEPSPDAYGLATALLLISSTVVVIFGCLAAPLLEGWLRTDSFAGPYTALLLLALPATTLAHPALALLERKLDYRSVAAIEVIGQVTFGIVGVTLAFLGAGVWAPIVGFTSGRVVFASIAWTIARPPPPRWSPALVGDMVRYGIGYSSATWVWQLRSLVNPLVVGGALGPEAVAVVALATRSVEILAFVRQAAYRIAVVAMAKVQRDLERSVRLLEEAMLVQTMALGLFLGGFALVGPELVALIYGPEWSGLFTVYPFIALGVLVNAVFNMHSSQLYVRKRNLDVAIFHLVHVALLAGGAFVFTRQFGIIGYGYAEIAALGSYWVIHAQLLKFIRPSYRGTVLWLGAYIPPLFAPLLDIVWAPLLWLPLLVVALLPRSRQQIRRYTISALRRRAS